MMQTTDKLLNQLKDKGEEKFYIIVDTARTDGLYRVLDEVENFNLFLGEEAILLEEVAPYLIEFKEDGFCKKLLKEQYENLSLLFVQSKESIEELANFFRSYTKVLMENEVTYFAFYDPRVFKRFMERASKEELEAFFSVAKAYMCEDAENNKILLHYSYDAKVIVKEIKVEDDNTKQ